MKTTIKKRLKNKKLKDYISFINRTILEKLNNKYYKSVIKKRNESFLSFNQNIIPHSSCVYNEETISKSNNEYDMFITGSDQVWNLNWYNPVFFLNFVDQTKKKISYAASIAMDTLTNEQKKLFEKHLNSFQAISVREQNSVNLLNYMQNNKIELVLDPTLLLNRDDWNKICADRLFNFDYVFCYFLGSNKKSRLLAKKYAKKSGLKIINVPFGNGQFISQDLNFGDINISDLSPQKFLSLIKYAKYIFTDSFHACVFSFLYNKEFFVFNRNSKGEMNDRIKNVTSIFDMEDRFCHTKEKETFKYINELPSINYDREFLKFEKLKKTSEEFLQINIGK